MNELKQKYRRLSKDTVLTSIKIPIELKEWLKKHEYNMTAILEQKCKELGWNGKTSIK